MIRGRLLRQTSLALAVSALAASVQGANTTYYVSSTDGSDGDNGLTPQTAFASIGRVNALNLGPGDDVLFRCGDTWRLQMLVVTDSGAPSNPIVYGSFPSGCTNQPVLSGSWPISGWVAQGGGVYMANLNAAPNAGHFAHGINQLFRGGQRLLLGRWPNLDAPDGGYSTVDGHNPGSARITDNELPAGNWTGATIHIKGIRWYMLNRDVTGTSGKTLVLNDDVICYTGNCRGWGYFINGHLNTLDRDGEWFHDAATNRVYLMSLSGPPQNIEGSAILEGEGEYLGAVILGHHLQEEISDVVIENFAIRNWFARGITTPTNLESDHNHRVTIRNNRIENVDGTGIALTTWVWNAGPLSGWRGGEDLEITDNLIDGANHFGIDSYAIDSHFARNSIRNIGLVSNLGRSCMGCGVTGTNCTENGAGIRIKLDPGKGRSGHGNTIETNRLESIGMSGMDVFGGTNVLRNNVIRRACYTKGDCGAIRLFGGNSFASTELTDVDITGNIIEDTVGNTDGCHSTFDTLFGFGIYIDRFSDRIDVSANTVTGSTAAGILFQDSRGTLTNNTSYDNLLGQLTIAGNGTRVNSHQNVFFGLEQESTINTPSDANLTASDQNAFFQPYRATNIQAGGQNRSFEGWQSYSGMDAGSRKNWFTLNTGEPPNSQLWTNPAAEPITLHATGYLDLDGNPLPASLVIPAFRSRVVIRDPDAPRVVSVNPAGWLLALWLGVPLTPLAAARVARLRRGRQFR